MKRLKFEDSTAPFLDLSILDGGYLFGLTDVPGSELVMAAPIRHLGNDYSVDHLTPGYGEFGWKAKDGEQFTFGIHTRYSPHCYSISLQDQGAPEGSHTFSDAGGTRVFCPERHAFSLSVPTMIEGVIAEPRRRVAQTYERNWSIYALKMEPPLEPGNTFYIFFRLKPSQRDGNGGIIALELYVESAYARANKVPTTQQMPFGLLALNTANK